MEKFALWRQRLMSAKSPRQQARLANGMLYVPLKNAMFLPVKIRAFANKTTSLSGFHIKNHAEIKKFHGQKT
jgi:hypothetical protein